MPSYVKSQAGIGLGSSISINTGSVMTPAWTPVGEIKSLSLSGRQVATDDVTNMESTFKEFIPTLADMGSWAITGNRVSADAGQVAMETAFQGLAVTMFKIQLPKSAGQTTAGDTYQFNALIADLNYSVALDKAVSFTATLKISGALTLTEGS